MTSAATIRHDLALQLQRERRPNAPVVTVPELRQWFTCRMVAQAGACVVIEWQMPLHRITFPTGLRGIIGHARVSAPGFRPRTMIVTADPFGKSAH